MIQRTITARDGDVIDHIAQEAYGRTAGAVEAILAANPTLADQGPRLAAGTVIVLPDLPATPVKPRVRLWD
jgi:P2-like prophage tail protein X